MSELLYSRTMETPMKSTYSKSPKQEETPDEDLSFEAPTRKSAWKEFREDFGFNFMHYIVVPVSGLILFAAYVYAEVAK